MVEAQSLTAALLAEIDRAGSTRDSIAAIYRQGVIACFNGKYDVVDWPTVNRKLLTRYEESGLFYIKRIAWKDL